MLSAQVIFVNICMKKLFNFLIPPPFHLLFDNFTSCNKVFYFPSPSYTYFVFLI